MNWLGTSNKRLYTADRFMLLGFIIGYHLLVAVAAIFNSNYESDNTVTTYRGYHLYRVTPMHKSTDLPTIMRMVEELEEFTKAYPPPVIAWGEPARKHSSLDILVSPSISTSELASFFSRGGVALANIELLNDDIQRDIDEETRRERKSKWRRRMRAATIPPAISTKVGGRKSQEPKTATMWEFDLNRFHRYTSIVGYLQAVARENPHIVQLLELGRSFERRVLIGLKVGFSKCTGSSNTTAAGIEKCLHVDKPAIFIDAGMHAREWIAPAAALYLVDRLVRESPPRRKFHHFLHTYDVYIVPVVNPDGYEHSHAKDRLWRKTRSRRPSSSLVNSRPRKHGSNTLASQWCIGADANRNWGYRWGEDEVDEVELLAGELESTNSGSIAAAQHSPCSNIYAGDREFSEPETLALRNFIVDEVKTGNLKIYLSLHSFGQMLLSPWGYTSRLRPDNYARQRGAALRAIEAMYNATGARYQHGTIAELMYPASGTSIDYWQHHGVPYIYGVELRPEDTLEGSARGFTIPPEFIEPTGRELTAGVKAIGEYAMEADSALF